MGYETLLTLFTAALASGLLGRKGGSRLGRGRLLGTGFLTRHLYHLLSLPWGSSPM